MKCRGSSALCSKPHQHTTYASRVLVECVTASLMAQHSSKPPLRENYTCQICNELLVSPVVLSCAHRFCLNCLGM